MLALYDAFAQVRNFLEAGGPVLKWIMLTAFVLWLLVIERAIYFSGPVKKEIQKVLATWEARDERTSWNAHQIRRAMISQVTMDVNRGMSLIKTLTAMCPLLGLIGTVTGMITVFDVMAVMGSGNVRAMAAGVSQATIPTMSGLVVALSGLFATTFLERRATKEAQLLEDHLTMDH